MNSQDSEFKRSFIDRDQLPEFFPTHRHSALFWEHLGRTIATFGCLEEVLGKAIFAFTMTRRYNNEEDAEAAYKTWLPQLLQQALTDQLWNLAEKYGKAVRNNPDSTISNIDELVSEIKKAAKLRNVLCHGSWGQRPDETGKSLPQFVSKNCEVFDTPIDIEFLRHLQRRVVELCCDVMDSVTLMGWQFPGGVGLGKEIWPKDWQSGPLIGTSVN